jgi:hypothetical protein
MNPIIKKIKEQLEKFPDVEITHNYENSISVKPKDESSFPVTLTIDDNKYTINFKGWYRDFFTEDEALDCFAFGLSNDCRLKVISVNKIEYRWILELKEAGKWVEDSEANLSLFPFWKKKKITYYRNKLLKLENQ